VGDKKNSNPPLQKLWRLNKKRDMKKLKITLVKSPIDRSERQKLAVKALGLKKTNSSKEVVATPQILGMIRKVTHLIKVEEA
jgi:large subunit ribosomal protein L30